MKIPSPKFEIHETVGNADHVEIIAGEVGKVESRSWVEYHDQEPYWRYSVRWPGGGVSNIPQGDLKAADRLYCDLRVVVSGVPQKLESWTTEYVSSLIERVLERVGVTKINPGEWDLRTGQGAVLKHLVGDAELVDGETILYLDPHAGGGGRPSDDSTAVATAVAEEFGEAANEESKQRLTDEIAGWQGTEPLEGTRRHLIREAIETVAIQARAQSTTAHFSQLLADAVESALLERTIKDEEEQDTGASKGNDTPTEGGFVPDEFDCTTAACERLFERLNSGPVPNCAELARTIDILRHGVKH